MSASKPESGQHSVGYEIVGIALVVVAIFLGIAFLSYQPARPQTNLVGIIGYLLADLFCSALGKMSYGVPALAVYTAGLQFRLWCCPAVPSQMLSLGVCGLAGTALLSLWYGDRPAVEAGGWLGAWLAVSLRYGFNQLGAYLVLIPVLVVSLMGIFRLSLHTLGGRLMRSGRSVGEHCADRLGPLAERLRAGLGGLAALVPSHQSGRPVAAEPYLEPEPRFIAPEPEAETGPRFVAPEPETPPSIAPAKNTIPKKARHKAEEQPGAAQPPPIIINRPPPAPAPKAMRPATRPGTVPTPDSETPYTLPGLELLDPPPESRLKVDEDALHASSQILESKLKDFGVKGKVVAVRPGPVITTYEFEPAPGVKVNRVVSVADDLQMALRAVSVRILAPIPGKAVVGIEVSNPDREKVYLREILDSPGFQQTESPLGLALGKDSIGNPVVADLARMPHLLVAGATGTGKSVSLNAMIMSLLYRARPRDVRFIMIDPKMLELSLYENLPHQLSHVITNPKEAGAALQEVVRQMEHRYKLLRDKGARNIASYNYALEHGETDEVIKLTEVVRDEGDEFAGRPELDDQPPPAPQTRAATGELAHQRLPYLVVIVDELADLMLTVGREIEEPITRLAQMGRASGIHLILATQRPSVDVITGLIKANFPARVSFQVSSRIDSRTILDAAGAERLLGAGDLLFLPPGSAKPQRIHGAFVSEPEISKAVRAIKKQAKPVFDSELVSALEKAHSQKSADADDDDTYDEMYEKARDLVIESRQASISWVQRRLRVGYNRAARMIERMEREGLIAPAAEAGKPRQVLVEAAAEE